MDNNKVMFEGDPVVYDLRDDPVVTVAGEQIIVEPVKLRYGSLWLIMGGLVWFVLGIIAGAIFGSWLIFFAFLGISLAFFGINGNHCKVDEVLYELRRKS